METTANKSLTALIGCQGTGKSTWTREQIEKNTNVVSVNRDNIRRLLFSLDENFTGYYSQDSNQLHDCENSVTQFQHTLVIEAARQGKDVILDATHAEEKYIRQIIMKYSPYFGVENINFKIFGDYSNTDNIKTYWSRTIDRGFNNIEYPVVEKFFNKVKNLLEDFNYKIDKIKKEVGEYYTLSKLNNRENTSCVIFDIDGTLADHNGRDAFKYEQCINDLLIAPSAELLNVLDESNGFKIILCSGRPEEYRYLTEKWLENNNIFYDQLLMRESHDYRPDYIVKSELWRKIMKDHYIEFMVDDRVQVIEHARNCGFFVFQVQNEVY